MALQRDREVTVQSSGVLHIENEEWKIMGEQKSGAVQEQDVKQLLKVRREKLADLQEPGDQGCI